jgi:DNA polymerase-1
LQNIPIRTDEGRRIRLAFVPGKTGDVLLTADYAQIELRVLAHFTQEPALLESFKNNEDVHRKVAAEVFNVPLDQVSREQRAQAKIVNFGIIYGVTAHGLARRIDGMNNAAAAELIAAYNARFPSIARLHGPVRAEGPRRRLRRNPHRPPPPGVRHQQRRDHPAQRRRADRDQQRRPRHRRPI